MWGDGRLFRYDLRGPSPLSSTPACQGGQLFTCVWRKSVVKARSSRVLWGDFFLALLTSSCMDYLQPQPAFERKEGKDLAVIPSLLETALYNILLPLWLSSPWRRYPDYHKHCHRYHSYYLSNHHYNISYSHYDKYYTHIPSSLSSWLSLWLSFHMRMIITPVYMRFVFIDEYAWTITPVQFI